jgi:hypothetical protein
MLLGCTLRLKCGCTFTSKTEYTEDAVSIVKQGENLGSEQIILMIELLTHQNSLRDRVV